MLQRQLEGMTEGSADAMDMQFPQVNGGGPNSGGSGFHPGSFLNGLPPPGMPGTMFAGIPVSSSGDHGSVDANVNGMWIGPGNNLKGKVPMPNSMMGEQQLTESGMVNISTLIHPFVMIRAFLTIIFDNNIGFSGLYFQKKIYDKRQF